MKKMTTMKKLILLFTILPCLAFAQTQEETEKWLLSQVPLMNNNISFKIVEGEMIRKDADPYILGSGFSKTTIPLKQVKMISLEPFDKAISFKLECEDECAYWVRTNSNGKFEKDSKSKVLFFAAFARDGKVDKTLIPRIEKALLHLIKLNGGNAKVVPYQKRKEAF